MAEERTDSRLIVVGVDDSDSARDAAEWAADLASVWRAPLCLLHTVGGQGAEGTEPGWLGELGRIAERVGADPVASHVVAGDVVEVLLDRAAGARLLVVGSYGEGAVAGMLAGDTALALLAACPCPVAVIRGQGPGIPPPRGGPVVVGVDGSPTGNGALEFAAELAEASGARLVAMHTWADVAADESGRMRRLSDDWDALAQEAGEVLDASLAPVLERHPGLQVERAVLGDNPLRALLARADGARMLVAGHRRGLPPGGIRQLGSTSKGLVEFAGCPVVITPPVAGPEDGADRAADRSAQPTG
ncbi:universal stress protein [Pseudonocardia asaccharolytica]|uniref:Universal stress protein n=1 Tax=Pseudonocardia asaccharolytica DSM 44247 = NBRC 16224 TaxID=1123024 RepID=A0A511D6H5_9PSEU|nr:universal stress protein [Pseudonocardia asaccharolytica]GEL20390.1 universal stress protein [Pseudonocardia asaccharolytica DSM 44247 = NBRC 16224]